MVEARGQILADPKTAPVRRITTFHPRFSDFPPSRYESIPYFHEYSMVSIIKPGRLRLLEFEIEIVVVF